MPMPQSREFADDDQEIVRYLLGHLPDDKAERFDEASIVDDDMASRLRSVENDLVDAYVGGTLAAETRARFETFYLSSPRRRHKVRSAQRFLNAVDRAHVSGAVNAAPAASGWALPSPRLAWSAVAAVFLLLACGVLVIEHVRLREGLSEARREGAASDRRIQMLTQQLEEGRAEKAEALKTLEGARAPLAARRPSAPGSSPPPASGSTTLAPLALVLSPQTRAPGPLPTVALSPALDRVGFELRLESNDFSRYRVDVKDPGSGRTVWRSAPVLARVVGGESFVSIAIPAARLAPQHYSLALAGLDAGGRMEPVASYTFQINRP
jgi:hypothetical protein